MIRLLLSGIAIYSRSHRKLNRSKQFIYPTPTRKNILAAEQKLMQSKQEIFASATRLNKEMSIVLAKPSTIFGVAGAAGLAGFFMTSRSHKHEESELAHYKKLLEDERKANRQDADSLNSIEDEDIKLDKKSNAKTSFKGVIARFALRYAMHRLPDIISMMMNLADKNKQESEQAEDQVQNQDEIQALIQQCQELKKQAEDEVKKNISTSTA